MNRVRKYRMFVQVRTDLTEEEIAQYEASATNDHGPKTWPWRETGDVIHARRQTTAKAFYRALKQIPPLIRIRAVRLPLDPTERTHHPAEFVRAWRGFSCLCGSINGVEDEVKHFEVFPGQTACGLDFSEHHWSVNGKPECDKCLAAAVEAHPEMKQYL